MFERFSEGARTVVIGAREFAVELHHERVGTEHMLLALVADAGEGGAALREVAPDLDPAAVRAAIERHVPASRPLLDEKDAEALRSVGIDLEAVLSRIEQNFGPDALRAPAASPRGGWFRRGRDAGAGRGRFGPRAKKVLELSLREALRRGDPAIGTGHVLLGLVREGEGLGARILVDAGVDLAALRAACERRLGQGRAA